MKKDQSMPVSLPNKEIDFSIVIPVYNEEEVMPELLRRVYAVADSISLKTEIILVNDGSADQTRELINKAALEDMRIVGINFSRNFGHQMAISAGLEFSRGETVAVIDGDLQDSPEDLPLLLAKLKEGYDVVYAIRNKRKENFFKVWLYTGFYRLHNLLSPFKLPVDSGDFCVMTRRVVDVVKSMPESHRYVRGLRYFAGFRQTGFLSERQARTAGASKYNLGKLLILAVDGILMFSLMPLRMAIFLGMFSSFLAIVYSAYLVVWRLYSDHPIEGFATIAVAVMFLGGVQLICIGIMGEYIGRIFSEVKRRPPYIIDSIVTKDVIQ